MEYNLCMNICAVAIYIVILFLMRYKKKTTNVPNNIFNILTWTCLIATIADTIASAMIGQIETVPIWLVSSVLIVYFLFQNIIPFLYFYYILKLVDDTGKINGLLKRVMVFAPITISLLMILFNMQDGVIFFFDENKLYTHRFGFFMLCFIAYYYMLVGLIHVLKNKAYISKSKRYALYSFEVLSMLPVSIQIIFPNQLISLFAISLCLLLILFTIQNPEDITDKTTGLLNYSKFNTVTDNMFKNNKPFIVQYIVIKNRKMLSNVFGYNNISDIIAIFATQLVQMVRRGNKIYCIDDGKFAIIYNTMPFDGVYKISGEWYDTFKKAWSFKDLELELNVSIAVIECPQNEDSISSLHNCFQHIDEINSNQKVITVDCDALAQSKRTADIETAISNAIENNSFQVYYQPIYSAAKKRIYSAEALVRLFDPILGFIPPDEFIPVSEKNGMIVEIGIIVFESVCKMLSEHKHQLAGIDYIEVNLSVVQCMQNNLWQNLLNIMERYDIPATKINLEITESAAAHSFATLINNMQKLHDAGITFSLDDYGTGYSTVNYVTSLPFKLVKLDRSMIVSADQNEKSQIALESTVRMMKSLDLLIVAEGIETLEHKEKIISLGCDYLQGYYFSKPVPKEDFLEIVTQSLLVTV